MILALIGTNPYPFTRLAGFLTRLAEEAGEQIMVQAGATPPPQSCASFTYLSHVEILALIEKADLVIAQGGYGSCLDVLEAGKPLILVPRLQELNEARDDQTELSDHLQATKQAIRADSYEDLAQAVREIRQAKGAHHISTGGLGKDVAMAIRDFLGIDFD